MECDVLIVGCGIAGLSSAISLSDKPLSVIIIDKDEECKNNNTYYAQGGIVYTGHDDAPSKLKNDILNAGAGLCYPEHVDILCHEGPRLVKEILLDKCQINFSQDEAGQLDLTEEGAHSTRRIIHIEDTTGKTLQQTMLKHVSKANNIKLLKGYTAIDLLTREHQTNDYLAMYREPETLGVYALDNKTGEVKKILSKALILATGGCGRIYLHTTNPPGAVGSGFAMAYRAGAKLVNMEYTQFHPTTLFHKDLVGFLISEAVRGEGAILINRHNQAFMKNYHEKKELAPRDIVTRAILEEMIKTDDSNVYLDMTGIPKSKIDNHFPNIKKKCKSVGIEIENQPIPVVPAYHFICGGIKTDSNGRTDINRLYAVGETACTGVHGANRLASTSLLEGLVFGNRAANHIWENWQMYQHKLYCDIPDWIHAGNKNEDFDIALLIQDWSTLRNTLWNYVGPVRTRRRLVRAKDDLSYLKRAIENFYRNVKIRKEIIDLRNAVQTAFNITQHAWINRMSRGCHFRLN